MSMNYERNFPAARRTSAKTVLAAMDRELADHVSAGEIAGVDVLLVHRGEHVHRFLHGYRDLDSGAALSHDTIYRIYSMTKPVTAVGMMLLYEEGLWSPDDPIDKLLPEFSELKGPDGKPLTRRPTLRQLLTHTAGFAYGVGLGAQDSTDAAYANAGVWEASSLSDMVERLADIPLAYRPGETWRYSLGMDIEGAIIERLSGTSFPNFLRERIFEPLGMVDTGFCVPDENLPRLATLYHKIGVPDLTVCPSPLLPPDPREMPRIPSGGGGLYSTTADYARFCEMLLRNGELDGICLLAPESVKLMRSNHLPPDILSQNITSSLQHIGPGQGYGFNCAVFHDPAAAGAPVGRGTFQWDGAGGTWFWVDPENEIYFIGMVQRVLQDGFPRFQEMTQRHVAAWMEAVHDEHGISAAGVTSTEPRKEGKR